jgi:AcrR family transcriptional regulator
VQLLDPPRPCRLARPFLWATQDLLIKEGFERLSMDAVARQCRASKATIYRRRPSKTALVVAAAAALFTAPDVPDTGDLREDLPARGRYAAPKLGSLTKAAFVEVPGDARDAVAGETLAEHPGDMSRCASVRCEALETSAPTGVGRVGMGTGADKAVVVGRSSAEVAALLGGLVVHRRQDSGSVLLNTFEAGWQAQGGRARRTEELHGVRRGTDQQIAERRRERLCGGGLPP